MALAYLIVGCTFAALLAAILLLGLQLAREMQTGVWDDETP